MPTPEPIAKAVKRIDPAVTSKADKARVLFRNGDGAGGGYTVTEVSKALGMAYSQAHSIFKSMDRAREPSKRQAPPSRPGRPGKVNPGVGAHTLPRSGFKHTTEDLETIAKRDIPTARALAKNAKAKKGQTPQRKTGKLRTPGMPSDIDAGPCANCQHDLAIRSNGGTWLLIHVNTTAEEYLATTQFCIAVPEALIPL